MSRRPGGVGRRAGTPPRADDSGPGAGRVSRSRVAVFMVIALAASVLGAVAVGRAALGERQRQHAATATSVARGDGGVLTLSAGEVVFRSTTINAAYGGVAGVRLGDPRGPRQISPTQCERIYATATRALCLAADRGFVTTYKAVVTDQHLHVIRTLPLQGVPSRARLSADGSMAATTTFVTGHSYTDAHFSTQTNVYDLVAGEAWRNIETFRLTVDGQRVTKPDINVWGVTFFPGPRPTRFYATAATGGATYLVRGDLEARSLVAIHPNAECPSLSPDGRVLVYKKRAGSQITWRLYGYEISTGREWPLPETRSVDDQVEWLDATHVLYGLPRAGQATTDVWVSDLHTGPPVLFLSGAWSPVVIRAA